jgi:hypothetical protein
MRNPRRFRARSNNRESQICNSVQLPRGYRLSICSREGKLERYARFSRGSRKVLEVPIIKTSAQAIIAFLGTYVGLPNPSIPKVVNFIFRFGSGYSA